MSEPRRSSPWPLFVLLLALAALLTAKGLVPLWPGVSGTDPAASLQAVLLRDSFAPRVAMAWLAGAALGLAGALFQQVLRNPLAEPGTLGVSAGANLALSLCLIWTPDLLAHGLEGVALAGAALATLLLFAIAWQRTLVPMNFILAGMVISLYCGALNALLILFNHDYLSDLFLWQAGSLSQNGWGGVTYLLPRLLGLALLAALLTRPLATLGLADESAASLGVNLARTRVLALAIAVALSACVVASVGPIGFIGLAAPAIARLSGARRLPQRLLWAPLLGAALLWLVDQGARELSALAGEVPAGLLTSVLSVPLLLWLLGRQPRTALLRPAPPPPARAARRVAPLLVGGLLVLAVLLVPALLLGRTPLGWSLGESSQVLLHWRLPRVAGALAAGTMLAVAGALVQRLTGNPMASPEVLGVSSGAALAVMLLFLLVATPQPYLLPAALLGAMLALGALLAVGRRDGYGSERMLLTGVCLTTLLGALGTLLLASGDPRVTQLLGWMTGSTYAVDGPRALLANGVMLLGLGLALALGRPLDLLALGAPAAAALGLRLGTARLALVLCAALLTATATLVVGPLSFVGLIAPHLARQLGIHRARPQLALSALAGAGLMLVADWLGRNLAYPWPVSAGLLAAFIGCPYFLWLMRRDQKPARAARKVPIRA